MISARLPVLPVRTSTHGRRRFLPGPVQFRLVRLAFGHQVGNQIHQFLDSSFAKQPGGPNAFA